jgi:hypothetical protein
VCPVNATLPPLTCPNTFSCCRQPWEIVCAETECTVCAECCHAMNATQCLACVSSSCAPGTFGGWGCEAPKSDECCAGGVPLAPNATLPNCLLVGDSVTNGLFPFAAGALEGICQTQHIENVDAANEMACWTSESSSAATGQAVSWDVVHFNEGLHSLWPRVNTTAEMQAWAQTLANFTALIQQTNPNATLIYATMTPYPPEWFLNPPGEPQQDVETKNALAVSAVKGAGVSRINDLYSVVTSHCGPVPYRNCSWCDDESAYHPGIVCGYHYVTPGWEALSAAVVDAVKGALKERGQLREVAGGGG